MTNKKILLIEDNEMNAKLMMDILSFYKYDVTLANHPKKAYEDLNNNQYDLILLDIQLPEISGYELLSSINKKLKVIVVSACAMEEEINKAYEYGCLDYITKPINVADFIKRIKVHID